MQLFEPRIAVIFVMSCDWMLGCLNWELWDYGWDSWDLTLMVQGLWWWDVGRLGGGGCLVGMRINGLRLYNRNVARSGISSHAHH